MLDFYYAERMGRRRFPTRVALSQPDVELRLRSARLPFRYLRFRRVAELVAIAMTLPLTLPLALLVSVAIRIDSPGPVIYWQYRPGRNGRLFRMFKFRSMYVLPVPGSLLTDPGDVRITRLGRFIRRHRIDEIPQLWNVIVGDMSLVGPRPEPIELSMLYESHIPLFRYRRMVRPGITGWAQVRNGYAASIEATTIKLEDDLFYILNLGPRFDLKILLRTVRVVITGYGAR